MTVRMPISVTGIWTARAPSSLRRGASLRAFTSGFTLVEILVVIVIIAIIATMFVFSLGAIRRNDPAFTESQRMASLINLARDQAALDGLDLGLRVDPQGYVFLTTLDPRLIEWIPPADLQAFRPRTLATGLEFRLWVEEQEVLLEDPDKAKRKRRTQAATEPPPQVLVLSSGDITPFRVVIERDGLPITSVSVNDEGEISLISGDEEAT